MRCWTLSVIGLLAVVNILNADLLDGSSLSLSFQLNEPNDAQTLQVTYGNKNVERGNKMTPKEVQVCPTVKWKAEPDCYYTIIFIDVDAEFIHWLVVNIPGDKIENGETVVEYAGSVPGKDSGLHRYVFLLFKQIEKIKCDEPHIPVKDSAHLRIKFCTKSFAEKYKLGQPIAVKFYLAQYDDTVDLALKLLGNP